MSLGAPHRSNTGLTTSLSAPPTSSLDTSVHPRLLAQISLILISAVSSVSSSPKIISTSFLSNSTTRDPLNGDTNSWRHFSTSEAGRVYLC